MINYTNSQIAQAAVVLSWSNPTDTDYTQVVIYRGSTALSTPSGTPLAIIDGTTTSSYRDSDVKPSTVYVYTLFTRDIDGVYSEPQSITFTTAAAPTVSSVSSGGRGGGGGGGSVTVASPQIQQCPVAGSSGSTVFSRTLNVGSRGDDVKALQVLLNKNGFNVSLTGVGSSGQESTYFGEATKAAVIRFQNTYAAEILTGGIKANGIVGAKTLAKLNSLAGSTGTTSSSVPCIINPVNSTIATNPTITPVTGISSSSFTRNLTIGSRGEDVRLLQVFLNSKGYTVSNTGAGSKGQETIYFGPATKAALARFQSANSISPAVGYFGPKTRVAMK